MLVSDQLPDDLKTLKELLLRQIHLTEEEAKRAEEATQKAKNVATELAQEQQNNQLLLDIIEGLKRQLFGRKTERFCGDNENQLQLFESKEPLSNPETETPKPQNPKTP